jgi:transcriptional regulator with XRE-family HTH domain
MSPRSPLQRPSPAAAAFTKRLALEFGQAVAEERRRRGWTMRELADRAHISASTVVGVEAGRAASMDVCGRLAVILGLGVDVKTGLGRRRSRESTDIVHSAMGEIEADLVSRHAFEVALDHPYQHYQFAGRADVLAWSRELAALLHIENRTRFPDIQQVAGSFNAKCAYLARSLARQLGVSPFVSETHVIVGLWSAEVIHAVRRRPATFRALTPDGDERLMAWLRGDPPTSGVVRSFVLLDPFAAGRQRAIASLDAVLDGVRPRVRGYREATERLGKGG